MNHGSLFSGIGGFDLAAELNGWQNKFHCDINSFCRTVLEYYWPNAKSYEDITKTDFTIWRGRIDILTGGFPCQPYSTAGKRLGKEDARHLWPEMLRAIREIRPRWIVGENVRGLTNWNRGVVFDEVQHDLENEGYQVQSFILPACAVEAPHERYRVWIVAYNSNARIKSLRKSKIRTHRFKHSTNSKSWGGGKLQNKKSTARTRQSDKPFGCVCRICNAPNSNNKRFKAGRKWNFTNGQKFINWLHEKNLSANSTSKRQPSKEHGQNEPRFFTETQFSDYWRNFPTQSPICSGNDGIPSQLDGVTISKWRNETIAAAGNAVVPQLVYQIFKSIQEYDNLTFNSGQATRK